MNVSLQILGTTSFVLSNFTNTSQFLPENNGLNANFDYKNNVAGFPIGLTDYLFVNSYCTVHPTITLVLSHLS